MISIGQPAPLGSGEFELAIMIAQADRRDAWVGLSPDLQMIDIGLVWLGQLIQLERNGALSGVHAEVCPKRN